MSAGNVVKVPSGSKLGIGFSRAVRVGDLVFVSGCAPIAADGSVAAPGDVKGQTSRCFDIIEAALVEAGADMKHVVRTRIFLTDMARWKEAAEAHGERFAGEIEPATSFLGTSALINPGWLVEVEADAVVTR
ncbi:MAG TPA: RidA family protein [Hyphomonadaceae bacterium]|nr:RidA family protein [Hyphomonadaceae bacterium]